MKRYVIRRLLMAIPLLLAISFVCFVFINIIPSNPAEVALRVQQMPVITEEAIAEMEEMLGLNKPFLVRYFDWVLGCLRGRFAGGKIQFKLDVQKGIIREAAVYGDFFSTLDASTICDALIGCPYERGAVLAALRSHGIDGAVYRISAEEMAAAAVD